MSGRGGRVDVVLAYVPFVALCLAISSVSHLSEPPIPELLQFRWSDKLLHFGVYGVVGFTALIGAGRRRYALSRAAQLEAVGLAALHGFVDEVHQAFVPGRLASVGDGVADLLGAVVGVGLTTWIVRKLLS
jgi:VanZ family protein